MNSEGISAIRCSHQGWIHLHHVRECEQSVKIRWQETVSEIM